MTDPDRFTLTAAPPPKRRRTGQAALRAAEEAAAIARADVQRRLWVVTSERDVAFLDDPAESGRELEGIVRRLVEVFYGAPDAERIDLALWREGRLVAVVRRDRKGAPVVTRFGE